MWLSGFSRKTLTFTDIGKINRQILHEMKAENVCENDGSWIVDRGSKGAWASRPHSKASISLLSTTFQDEESVPPLGAYDEPRLPPEVHSTHLRS